MAPDSSREIHIRADGGQSTSDPDRFPVSQMGHIMPKLYVMITEVFALPEGTDTEAIVKSMVAGLESTISQFPILVGTLEMDVDGGQMWVTKESGSQVSLRVKHMLEGEAFSSYEELADRDFPLSLLPSNKLLPASVTEKPLQVPPIREGEAQVPVASFQLNFIRGGLVLAMAVHHAVSDAHGCDDFLTAWAQSTMAAFKGLTSLSSTRQYSLPHSPLHMEKPSAERMAAIKNAYPELKDAGGPMAPPPANVPMPTLVWQLWHFPKSKLNALKAEASVTSGSGWISTYDATTALLWSAMIRTRLEMLKPDMDSESIMIGAIDMRKVWDPPLPRQFLGNAAAPGRCGPLAIKDIINPSNLARLAQTVRSSITNMTPQYLSGMLEWVACHDDQRYLEVNVNCFLSTDFAASSWQKLTAYEKHDFGFGLPSALRWPNPPIEGFVILYPSRAAVKGNAGEDEGVEVSICLEQGCHQRLMKDEVMLAYAEPRGM